MSVGIVTDSAAALPDQLVRDHAIRVVPMWLNVDGISVREGDMALGELLGHSEVKTSGPAPGDFAHAIEETLEHHAGGALVCTIASTMSSTYDAAVLGAQAVADEHRVRVVDTRTAAGAQGLVVLAAAEAAARGASLEATAAAARDAMPHTHLAATVPNLDHLVRSGRVPNIAGWAGKRLGVAPLFEFANGRARPLRPALGLAAASDRILSRLRRDRDREPGSRLHVAALHAQAEDQALALLDRVHRVTEPRTEFVAEFGTVMVAHTGPGLVGLAWRWEPEG
jgi:DegV family protein with EDD domain